MVSQSELSMTISDRITEVLAEDRLSEVSDVDVRECDSDRFSGVQLKIYGRTVNTRPIIDYIAEQDGLAIEDLYHCTSGDAHLGVFIAYLPTQEHPAFV